jgi:cellulose synthase/poly-beta-1,6-N-acetylglucosamine synthase-like glycosyltransferase
MDKKVSIIIPVKEINDYIREAIPYHLKLEYDNFEILIFPDLKSNETFEKTIIIPSGKAGPAEKRDMAIEYATGDILAFIDDDAYPRPDWLKNAVKELEPEDVGAVGGPAVTAQGDDLLRQASGKIFENALCSGKYSYRYVPGIKHDDDDIPSVNLIVKKDIFEKVGGFDSSFYPGEDTKLCLDIVKKAGKRIVYDPEILVYHHRRPLFKGHLKQATGYAKHRGYFAKKLPQTSLRIQYFVPSIFLLGVLLGPIACIFFPVLWFVYTSILILYFLLVSVNIKKVKSIKLFFLVLIGVFVTHVSYGFCFIQGLLSKKLLR